MKTYGVLKVLTSEIDGDVLLASCPVLIPHWESALSTHWSEHINHKWPFVTAPDKRRETYCVHWQETLRYRKKRTLA